MANIFLISDTHFGHAKILTFEKPDGTLMRPEFSCVEEMDEFMVQEWNKVVYPSDKVYHLGDVAMYKRDLPIMARLNGHKRLVRGNHDDHPMKLYTPYFDEIYGSRILHDLMLSHIPLHPESVKKNYWCVHGHVHNNVPQGHFGPRFYNVSVEHTGYRPLALEDVRQRCRKQAADYEARSAAFSYGQM